MHKKTTNDLSGFWRKVLPVNQCAECHELSINYFGVVLWVVLTGVAIILVSGA